MLAAFVSATDQRDRRSPAGRNNAFPLCVDAATGGKPGTDNRGEYMQKTLCLLAVAGSLVTLAAPAHAQFNKPEDAIRYRQSAFVLMGNHMGRINAQLKSSSPNIQVIQSSAALA